MRNQNTSLRNNLSEHLSWIQRSQASGEGILTGFIYSLPGQNPYAAGDSSWPPSTRETLLPSLAGRADIHQVAKKAWQLLSSTQQSKPSFLPPGVTAPVQKAPPISPGYNGGADGGGRHPACSAPSQDYTSGCNRGGLQQSTPSVVEDCSPVVPRAPRAIPAVSPYTPTGSQFPSHTSIHGFKQYTNSGTENQASGRYEATHRATMYDMSKLSVTDSVATPARVFTAGGSQQQDQGYRSAPPAHTAATSFKPASSLVHPGNGHSPASISPAGTSGEYYDAVATDDELQNLDIDEIVSAHYDQRSSQKLPAGAPDFSSAGQAPSWAQPQNGHSRGIQQEEHFSTESGNWPWSDRSFPWTRELEITNRREFGNPSFRPNQREVMNATISKRDAFVLMPTGGGKSLTYQLPAICFPGVTLVISPLVSLIMDQIMHLEQNNVPAAYLSSSQEWSEVQAVMNSLRAEPCFIKLLYVTPEKIAKSESLLRILEDLYRRERLARIVIDEAHCVSEWGHDFRPDYRGLKVLREKFPDVPILALTATATILVKEDVVRALGLRNCIVFMQSFNRPNLRYEVRGKSKKCMEEIDELIRAHYFRESGIVYCLSRNDCEKTAAKLRELGHNAAFYHGSMEANERNDVQRRWSKDEVNIICATVAFGMGINKPDVRFVIHHSMPKTIEGYHQESGRAGRDHLPATCILFYTYSDYIRLKNMLVQGAAENNDSGRSYGGRGWNSAGSNPAGSNAASQLEANLAKLLRMVAYCENDVDCRRSLQLAHFGETFEASSCKGTCDNCSSGLECIERDVTIDARQLVELIGLLGQRQSLQYVLDVYRGSNLAQIVRAGHNKLPLHGAGKAHTKGEAERILRRMVVDGILFEHINISDMYGSVSSTIKINDSKAGNLLAGRTQLKMRSRTQRKIEKASAPVKKTPIPMEKPAAPTAGKETAAEVLTYSVAKQVPGPTLASVDQELSAKVFAELKELRTRICHESKVNLAPYHVFQNQVLRTISEKLPKTAEEMLEVSGVAKTKVTKYGSRVLETIARVVAEHQAGTGTCPGTEADDDMGADPLRPPESATKHPVAAAKRGRDPLAADAWRSARAGCDASAAAGQRDSPEVVLLAEGRAGSAPRGEPGAANGNAFLDAGLSEEPDGLHLQAPKQPKRRRQLQQQQQVVANGDPLSCNSPQAGHLEAPPQMGNLAAVTPGFVSQSRGHTSIDSSSVGLGCQDDCQVVVPNHLSSKNVQSMPLGDGSSLLNSAKGAPLKRGLPTLIVSPFMGQENLVTSNVPDVSFISSNTSK